MKTLIKLLIFLARVVVRRMRMRSSETATGTATLADSTPAGKANQQPDAQ